MPDLPQASESLERLRAALADRYRVHRLIGLGGIALVFLANDLDRLVGRRS